MIETQSDGIESVTGFEEMACSGLRIDDKVQAGQRSDSSSSDSVAHQERREIFKKLRTGKKMWI